eukprot:scaffold122884_cov28-Tisochrysis_lutea.AAC.2
MDNMMGRSRLMSLESSTRITVNEIVIRVTPPSMPAAPTSAYTPGETRDIPKVSPAYPAFRNSPVSRPTAAPIIIQGTKRPLGRAMP